MEILTVDNFQSVEKKKKQKRRRLGKSCLSCRGRKIKCDQRRPSCSSCERMRIKDCIYTHEHYSSSTGLVIAEDGEKRNIFKDNGVRTKFEALEIKTRRIVYYGLTSKFPTLVSSMLSPEYIHKVRNYIKKDRREWKRRNQVNSIVTFDFSHEIDRLVEHLPGLEFMKSLLEQYFDSVWNIYTPILDKETIMEDFQRLFVLENSNLHLRLNEGIDYSILSLLLIIMKYMIQIDDVASEKYPIFLSSNDIFINLIEGFRPYDGNFIKRSSLPALQAILLQTIFKKFNVKDGECGEQTNSSIMFSICFRMAMSMGMHRDIDVLYCDKSKSYRDCLKETWKCLLYNDTWNSLDIGIPLQIQDGFFDNSILRDTSDQKVDLIIMLRSCCNKLTKFEVFEEDLVSCVSIIKDYLGRYETLFSYIDNLNTTQQLSYNLIKITNLIAAITLLQHLNRIMASCNIGNDEIQTYYDRVSTKYSILIVASMSAMIIILRNRLNYESEIPQISQSYFFGIGISLSYSIRAVFTLVIKVCENFKSNKIQKNQKIKISKIANYDDDIKFINLISGELEDFNVLNSVLMQLLESMLSENDDANIYSYYVIFCCIRAFNKTIPKENDSLIQDSRVVIDYSGCAKVNTIPKELHNFDDYDVMKDQLFLSAESAYDVTKLFEQFFGESSIL